MAGEDRSALVIDVLRGTRVESSHLVDAVVVDDRGAAVEGWGDSYAEVLPRSAIKPIQAVPLVTSGAADRFGLGAVELALACSSHQAGADHVATIDRWLDRLGLTEAALECGAQTPQDPASARELVRADLEPGPRHNNCSGKHMGFLTICRHLGLDVDGYIRPEHLLQRDHITPAVEELFQIDVSAQLPAIDGCGIPVWAVALRDLARGWVRLAAHPAGRILLDAMRAEPFFVAGSGRACTRIIGAAKGGAVIKTGAEGVFCGVVPDDGVGIALKARDGSSRASEAAIQWILHELGALDSDGSSAVTNWAGTTVGQVRVRR